MRCNISACVVPAAAATAACRARARFMYCQTRSPSIIIDDLMTFPKCLPPPSAAGTFPNRRLPGFRQTVSTRVQADAEL